MPAPLFRPVAALSVLACGVVFVGCAVGPEYRAPALPSGDAYLAGTPWQLTASAPGPTGAAQVLVHDTRDDGLTTWWRRFGAVELSALVERAFAGSYDLRAAEARLQQARHLLAASRGGRWPEVSAGVSATRERGGSGAVAGGGAAGVGRGATIFEVYTAAGTVSYDLDLAGGESHQIEAAGAQAERAAQALRAASLALAGNIVATAIDGARLAAQIDARSELIEAQRQRLSIIEVQVDAGAVARAELVSARADLAAARAPLPQLEQARVEAAHRLALLVGEAPASFVAPAIALDELQLPRELPLRLPAALVRERPDIRVAEAVLRAASAEIGVAEADLYPRITLDASFGRAGIDGGNDTSIGPLWSLGASLLAPIFDGGQRRARRDATVAAYDAALAEYRGTVLIAFTQVADVLRALENDARALAAQHEALVATRESLDLARFRFDEGAASYLDVLVTQQQYQQALIGYVDARAARLADTAHLFAALGGAAIDDGS